MNKNVVLLLCSLLLAGPVAVQAEQSERVLAAVQEREDKSRAMEQCGATHTVVLTPFSITASEKAISIKWSGACVESKRDGEGVLSWSEEQKSPKSRRDRVRQEVVEDWRAEGRFVKGQRLGLWCMTYRFQIKSDSYSTEAVESGCSVFAGNFNPITLNYRTEPDGRWQEFSSNLLTGSFLAAGTLEEQSAKVLADAAAGKTAQAEALVVQNQSLDDLVRGSKIVLATSAAPISLKDKRVAIVFSSQTVNELERFKRERQTLIDASAGLSGDAAAARASFIQASDPKRLLVLGNIFKVVKKYAGDARPADDLSGLQKGVVDWKYMTRFDLLGKYDKFPKPSMKAYRSNKLMASDAPILTGESLGGFLIDRNLQAVKQDPSTPNVSAALPKQILSLEGDLAYLISLENHFERSWGDGPDDLGMSTIGLDIMVREKL